MSRAAPSSKPKPTRKQLGASQRSRLTLALLEAIAESGYPATSVADVIERAGVSRKTFYAQFANKQECLLATFDMVAAEGMRRVESAYRRADGWPERVEAALRALFDATIEVPGALRLSLLEIAAAGPAGIERRERTLLGGERLLAEAMQLAPGEGSVSELTLKAVVGGLNRVLYARVGDDRAELLALVPELTAWAGSYYPTPAAMLARPSRETAGERPRAALEGGRAPGTLAPHPALGRRRGLPRGDQNASRGVVAHSQRVRLLDAVANLAASDGYAALKVEDIAERAAVSLKAFYEHYGCKEDAFLVAYEIGHAKGLAMVERAYTAESDWCLAVRAAIAALFEFLSSEPSFAQIALVDALIATPRTAERSLAGVKAFGAMLAPGFDQAPARRRPPAVTIDAICGGIFEVCLLYALRGGLSELAELTPTATYFALAPFVGGEQAARVALESPG